MAWGVYTGKHGKTKSSCHKDKPTAKKARDRLHNAGKSAMLRKVKHCGKKK
jgi:hypothetical protein